MSGEAFDAGLALRARHLGRAVPASATKRSIIHDEAIGIVPIAMAGERTGLWAVAIGKLRRRQPRTDAVGDARDRDEQARLWTTMAPILATAGDHPQLVVPHRHSARLLAESAVRFVRHPDATVAAAARLVWWCCTRREVAGSHALVVVSDLFAAHFAIGADGGPDDDLRLWLAWLESDGPDQLAARTAAREGELPDPKTTLEFDEQLWPKVARRADERATRRTATDTAGDERTRARAARDIQRQARVRAATVKAALQPTLAAGWERLLVSADRFAADPRPPLADLDRFCAADRDAWRGEQVRSDRGVNPIRRDSPRRAVIALMEADVARSCWEGALVWGDAVARARAVASGAAIVGPVASTSDDGFTVLAAGPVRARSGDRLAVDGEPPLAVDVVDVETTGEHVAVTVTWAGRRPPQDVGPDVALWPPPPDFGQRWLGWLTGRLVEHHWALGDDSPAGPPQTSPGPHVDRLAAVEALRNVDH